MRPAGEVVSARARERAQARIDLLISSDIEQIAGRACQPVEAVYNDHVAAPEMVEQPPQFWTVTARARELLFINPCAADLAEGGALKAEVLVIGRRKPIWRASASRFQHGSPALDSGKLVFTRREEMLDLHCRQRVQDDRRNAEFG